MRFQMNKVLISYVPIGPTYKDRVIDNIKKYDAYQYFDVLILTDDPQYSGFDAIRHLPNIYIDDLTKHRNKYPEFYEYEKIPTEKRSESIYKDEINANLKLGFRFPMTIQRFVFLYENISLYNYIIQADCDTVPLFSLDEYKNFEAYLETMKVNTVSSNRAYYVWEQDEIVKFLETASKKLNKNYQKIVHSFDQPLKILKFNSKEKIQSFFDTINYCCREVYFSNKPSAISTGSWLVCAEVFYAITYALENIELNLTTHDYNSLQKFKTYTYLEDRFWDNVIHDKNIDTLQNTKEDFIQKNMETLIKFYESTGQEFNHE